MRAWLWQVRPTVVALTAIAVGVASGLIAANVFGDWVQILAIRSGHPCSPCPPTTSVESPPPVLREFRPNDDLGLAVGVAVAVLVLVAWAIARREPAADRDLSR